MKPKYLKVENNMAILSGVNLDTLARMYQTPLQVFDEHELNDNIHTFQDHFQSSEFSTHIVYASKAFLTKIFASFINKKGLYMDAVSLGDLWVSFRAGYPMEKIVFHGNNKQEEELEFALLHDVLIVVDNIEELRTIRKLADKLNKKARTFFRMNPGIDAHTHKYIQTASFVSKFGESIYDEAMVDKIMQEYLQDENVLLLGFHSHIGSLIQETEPFIKNVEKMMEFTSYVEKKYQYPIHQINFGGGFGISYVENDIPLATAFTLDEMIKKIEEEAKKYHLNMTDCYIEPGRSILGDAAVTLYKVGALKHTYGNTNYLFIDGGMTDNIRPALYGALYACDIVNKMNDEKTVVADIAGKACESGDIIIHNALLPFPQAGDILMVYATGAYNYSMASNYNNALKPCVVMIKEDKNIETLAKRETLDDLLKNF